MALLAFCAALGFWLTLIAAGMLGARHRRSDPRGSRAAGAPCARARPRAPARRPPRREAGAMSAVAAGARWSRGAAWLLAASTSVPRAGCAAGSGAAPRPGSPASLRRRRARTARRRRREPSSPRTWPAPGPAAASRRRCCCSRRRWTLLLASVPADTGRVARRAPAAQPARCASCSPRRSRWRLRGAHHRDPRARRLRGRAARTPRCTASSTSPSSRPGCCCGRRCSAPRRCRATSRRWLSVLYLMAAMTPGALVGALAADRGLARSTRSTQGATRARSTTSGSPA